MKDIDSVIYEGLNPEQHKAVAQIDGPVLIVAGAGSGKTKVLTCRIANILAHDVPSSRVLSLTFTKKAAGEMKERVAELVGRKAARQLAMGTFHSVFIRFLRDYHEFLGYPQDFTIYDTSESISLIKACLKELNLDEKAYKPKTVLGRISDAKNSLVSPAAYMANQNAMTRDRNAKMPRLVEVYDRYWRKCREMGVMDFDDILFEMNILLRDNPAALEEIAGRFDYILVDEYQDTNRAQYLILKKLAQFHHRICVVGDDSQSIYAFRGAKIENILNFKRDYPDCHLFRLERNYRSTRTIVDAANSLIEHNDNRIPKKCYSEAEQGEPIHLIKAYSEQEEAMLVVSSIADTIRREGARYEDFAILYRTNAQSRALEEALRRRNIPYMIYSGNSFFDRAEVKDLMAYFKLIVNPMDNESFKRIVNKPARGIGDSSLACLSAAASGMNISLMHAIYAEGLDTYGLKPAAINKMRAFGAMILSLHERVAAEDAFKIAEEIAAVSGIYAYYKSDNSVEGQARLGNVEELLNSIKAFIEQKEAEEYEDAIVENRQALNLTVTLAEYLENAALLSAVDVDDDDSSNKVALMTVHTSKGLEFPYVHIVGLEENLFPSGGSMARESEIEEERRLFYVALTRACKSVKLSFCNERMRNGKTENNSPSRFIYEIDSRYIDNPIQSAQKAAAAEAFFGNLTGGRTLRHPSAAPQSTARPVPATPSSGILRPTPALTPKTPAPRPADEAFEASPVSDMRPGQRVEHNRFGFGVIKSITEDGGLKAKIVFDDYGEKVLLLKYAKIRII